MSIHEYQLTINARTAAREVEEADRSALVCYQGKRLLVVACRQASQQAVEDSIRSRMAWAGIDDLRFVTSLPVDRRDKGKIDYPGLHRLLDQSN